MQYKRWIEDYILNNINIHKVILIFGTRRSGKTSLLKKIMSTQNQSFLYLNGDDFTTRSLLENKGIEEYRKLLGGRKLFILDEAQSIPNIGKIMKVMIDEIESLTILASGSSAFDLAQRTGEPLTGRSMTCYLFPMAYCELVTQIAAEKMPGQVEQSLIYGSYPELLGLQSNQDREEYLNELVSSYLTKDILVLDNIRNSSKLMQILQLLAFQVGSEVSFHEISAQVGLSRNTVDRYIDILQKAFIIFRLGGLSRNLRKEVSKSGKIYFWDNGIRNALVANFNALKMRNDTGLLWENYVVAERIKKLRYQRTSVNLFFWRTYDGQEIDLIEERGGTLNAYEFKWKSTRFHKPPKAWKENYPEASFQVVDQNNCDLFLT